MPLPEPPDVQLLSQVGFLAAGQGDTLRALRIFEALALLRPDRAFPHVGMATALLNAGRPADAVQRLAAVHLPDGPESDMVGAFQALALQLAGRRGESIYVLRRIVDRVPPDSASDGAQLAARLLGEAPSAARRPEPVFST